MNISNDILFKAVSAFVDALSEGIAQSVEAKVSDRIQALEEKIDQLDTASDEYITTYVDAKFEKFVDDELDDHVLNSVKDLTFNAETTIDIRRY